MFAPSALAPKPERLSPAAGLKRLFSSHGLMELAKTLVKFVFLSGGAALLLWQLSGRLLRLGREAPREAIVAAGGLVEHAYLTLAAGLVLIALIDVPYQIYSHRKRLRMTRQEIKEELKESDGNPEMRARVRRLQRERAGRRMMQDVPTADVVITNPTHFSVALKYTDRPERAPRVVAKGRGLVAGNIRELAARHEVPVCEAPPLARAIYFNTEVGQDIPTGLYLAVARVLAWVMQLEAARRAGAGTPVFPADLPIPPELAVAERLDA